MKFINIPLSLIFVNNSQNLNYKFHKCDKTLLVTKIIKKNSHISNTCKFKNSEINEINANMYF